MQPGGLRVEFVGVTRFGRGLGYLRNLHPLQSFAMFALVGTEIVRSCAPGLPGRGSLGRLGNAARLASG